MAARVAAPPMMLTDLIHPNRLGQFLCLEGQLPFDHLAGRWIVALGLQLAHLLTLELYRPGLGVVSEKGLGVKQCGASIPAPDLPHNSLILYKIVVNEERMHCMPDVQIQTHGIPDVHI